MRLPKNGVFTFLSAKPVFLFFFKSLPASKISLNRNIQSNVESKHTQQYCSSQWLVLVVFPSSPSPWLQKLTKIWFPEHPIFCGAEDPLTSYAIIKKEPFCLKILLGQNIIQILQYKYSNYLSLCLLYWNLNWMSGFTVSSAKIPYNSVQVCCIIILLML